MNENVKRQQNRFVLYNLVAFTIIFTLFGFILYSQIRMSLYGPVEDSLKRSREIIMEGDNYIERQIFIHGERIFGQNIRFMPQPIEHITFQGTTSPVMPMRVQMILRDSTGQILNERALGRLYFDGYLEQIPFVGQKSDAVFYFQIDSSDYSSLIFKKSAAGGHSYTVQLIAGMEGERAVLNSFGRLIVMCVVVFIMLSITASIWLSRKTMAPLIQSWQRQSEFVENASHELRTPLAIIQSKLEAMLTEPNLTVIEKAEDIGISLSETRRLSKLTTDLMTLARADSSEAQLERESIALDELIAELVVPYREYAVTQEKQLETQLDFNKSVPADRSRIHQLMVILLDNALKYTRENDQIRISTKLHENRAVIEVADNGIGVPAEYRERVFDRFYRVDKARSRESGGSGLGLAIAKWIVDEHEGSIDVLENSGGGTILQVKLKL